MPGKFNRIAGTRICIIGGSTGIGYATAEAAIEHDPAQVTISSSSPSKVQQAVVKLRESYPDYKGTINGFPCNLKDDALEQNLATLMAAATENGTKKLDHVIHCAGDPLAAGPIDTVTLEGIKEAGMVRYFSTILLGKVAPKFMNPGPQSSITLTTGSVAQKPIKDWVVVGGFGAGLEGVTRGLALDLAPVRVNCVAPGVVDTGLWDSSIGKEAAAGLKTAVAGASLVGKVGSPEDVAQSFIYLLMDWNCTGASIYSTGGALLV